MSKKTMQVENYANVAFVSPHLVNGDFEGFLAVKCSHMRITFMFSSDLSNNQFSRQCVVNICEKTNHDYAHGK